MKIFIRWTLLILFAAASLLYLNSAMASAWVSGGPPTEYAKAWGQRGIIHFGYFVGLFFTGILAFVVFGKNYSFKKSKFKYVWLAIIILSLLYPKYREFILVDKCLDSGGSWDKAHFECKNQ